MVCCTIKSLEDTQNAPNTSAAKKAKNVKGHALNTYNTSAFSKCKQSVPHEQEMLGVSVQL